MEKSNEEEQKKNKKDMEEVKSEGETEGFGEVNYRWSILSI